MSDRTESGLVLLCAPQGIIVQVLLNDLNLAGATEGSLFPALVDEASRRKALNFLNEIREHATAIEWEMCVPTEAGPLSLHFSGGQMQDQLLIVGATNGKEANHLYADFLRINNEQTNQLRLSIKENIQAARAHPEEENLFDKISRLNNELVSMQRELSKKNAELERLNRLKNQFLGMAAHDLRNPLHAILSYSELLMDDKHVVNPQERMEFLNDIHSLSQFMVGLVNDLLSVSAIEAGELRLELQQVDLTALLQKNIARNRLLAARKQIDLALETEPIPPLLLDPGKIEQVLDNLISNAVKFANPCTQVRVRLIGEEQSAVLTVQDQGPGISAADMEKLFKPFGRTSARGTGGERSTGLGLVIVKRIVEGHAGTIRLESETGKGTTFFVTLPFECPEISSSGREPEEKEV